MIAHGHFAQVRVAQPPIPRQTDGNQMGARMDRIPHCFFPSLFSPCLLVVSSVVV